MKFFQLLTDQRDTAIDHILRNTIMDQDLQNGIIKLFDIYNLDFKNTQPVSKNKNINTNHKQSVGRKLQKNSLFDGLE